jgi:phosphoenolpyruvate carboxylase
VLTAHPTEVQRKSILDAEHDIARLLAERDLPLTPKERAANLHLLRARIATLWQTRMLRYQADRGRRDRTPCPTTASPSCANCRAVR